MSGLSHTPDETTLRDILVGELRQSKRLQYDIEIYDRAREGSEQRTYRFLVGSLKDLLTRERKRKNRDRIARSHGDKYGAAASSPGRTSSASGGGRGRSQSPSSPEEANPILLVSLGHLAPKEFATISSREHVSATTIAHFFIRRGLCLPKTTSPRRRSAKPVSSGRKGTARELTSAGFSMKMLRNLQLQPRSRRPPQRHPRQDLQGQTPPHRVEGEVPGLSPATRQASQQHVPSRLSTQRIFRSHQSWLQPRRMTRTFGRLISQVTDSSSSQEVPSRLVCSG